jgi:hypothetical protein
MTPFISKIKQHTLPIKAKRKKKQGRYCTSTKTKYYYNTNG